MNLIQVRRCSNVNCLSQQQQSIDNTMIFTRSVYQVDASILCQLVKQIETKCLSKSFGQLLYLASISKFELDRKYCSIKNCGNQERNVLLLTNLPDLISVAIDWNLSQCTPSDIEDLVSIINPFIYLRELFYDVTINDARIKQLNLIGLICFYGGSVEVFFSYDHTTLKWLFCFDGNVVVSADWNAVIRKCIDFHLQPFLLIYANPDRNPVDISQLLKRTVIQTKDNKIIPDERRLEQAIVSNNKKNSMITKKEEFKQQTNLLENLNNISSFATLNSSMLFMPKSIINNTSYINQETVVKVMQQQLLKKETLSDTTSISSSSTSTSSPLIHIRNRSQQQQNQQQREDTSSSGDSGLSIGINDESSDGSPRDSLIENEQTVMDSLIKQTEHMMNDDHQLDMSYTSIEHYFEESLKYESSSNYSSALESCQKALLLVEQILNLSHNYNNGISIYARTKKNSLLLRIRSLHKRQIEKQENLTRYSLIVPTSDDTDEPPSEHLIHSFLRKIHQQTTSSDSDSDTPSSLNDIPIGLSECTLCHKRCSKNNQIGVYCTNCHFYMQRFQPTT